MSIFAHTGVFCLLPFFVKHCACNAILEALVIIIFKANVTFFPPNFRRHLKPAFRPNPFQQSKFTHYNIKCKNLYNFPCSPVGEKLITPVLYFTHTLTYKRNYLTLLEQHVIHGRKMHNFSPKIFLLPFHVNNQDKGYSKRTMNGE